MWKSFVLLLCLSGYCLAGPVGSKRNMPIGQQKDDAATTPMESLAESEPATVAEPEMMIMSTLTLPSNATSIRADITDGFSCENKTYGYYADVENDCQIFHVCLPVTYADGKENTFRWSFICPEETIFSQDSFTCMRPDDMTITCDESIAYYDLNRNFGMVESEKEDTEMAAESENKKPEETVMAAESEAKPVKPLEQEAEKEAEIEAEKEAEKETPKPAEQTVKVQKPNRRKPGVSYAAQNKKTNNPYPLRKMPQVQPAVPETLVVQQVTEENTENEKPVQEEDPKHAVQKFSRRPVPAMSNTFKDKIQTAKPESMTGIRTQLFNQNRKRPSMFNKKPVEQPAEDEIKPEIEQVKVEMPSEQQMFSVMESEVPNANAETQVADSEIQASATNEVFVKPEEAKEDEAMQTEEESKKVAEAVEIPAETEKIEEPQPQVLEAFEEIPAVIAEVIENQTADEQETPKNEEQMPAVIAETVEDSQKFEESPTAEETQANQDMPAEEEESQKVKETEDIAEETKTNEESLKDEETKSEEETQKPEETQANEAMPEIEVIEKVEESEPIEETQSVEELKPVEEMLTVEEPQPVEMISSVEDNQTPQVPQMSEETQTVEEDAKPEEPQQMLASEEIEQVKTDTMSEPAIFENSEEGLALAPIQTIEEMEDEKPADAPESVVATEEMNHPDSVVQQMMEDMEENKHSIGGFKPVDPVMAQEAEQLIADFINTLRKNDFTNETPDMIMQQQHNNDEAEQEHEQIEEEASKMESSEVGKDEVPDNSEKTENDEEIVKTNEAIEIPQQPEMIENQSEVEDTSVLSQENTAEEKEEDVKEAAEAKPEIMLDENTDNDNESVALKSLEAQSSENVEESQKSEEHQAESSSMMFTNMPEEMFQIPVQVISSPVEEMPIVKQDAQIETDNKPMEMSASSEDKLEEETPAMMEGYKPLSIDDIVELVKERLDHMPKDEMETPMQLEQVLGDMKEEKATEVEEAVKEEEAKSAESQPAQSEEEIVMPIYQRLIQPVKVDAGVQTETQEETVEQSEVSDAAAADVKEKSNRSYRSRSMLTPKLDSRKRLFLFKSDKTKSS